MFEQRFPLLYCTVFRFFLKIKPGLVTKAIKPELIRMLDAKRV